MRPEQTFGTASGHAYLRQVGTPAQDGAEQSPAIPGESWRAPRLRMFQLLPVLAVQAAIGGLMLAFGSRNAGSGVPVGAVLGVLWVALNAAIVSLYIGLQSNQFLRRASYLGATILATLLATVGAVLASQHSAWQILSVLGTLANLELVALVARGRRAAA